MTPMGLSKGELIFVVVLTLAVTALSTLGTVGYLNRDNRWVQIVNPPQEKAVEFAGVSRLLQPYVRTAQRNLYFCSGSGWQDSCRQITQAELPVVPIPGRWQTCKPVFPPLPALPGQPSATLDLGQCQEGRTYARLVILEDGTIWKWERNFSWVNGFATGSIAAASLIVGLLLSLVAVHVRRYLRSPVPEVKSQSKAARPGH